MSVPTYPPCQFCKEPLPDDQARWATIAIITRDGFRVEHTGFTCRQCIESHNAVVHDVPAPRKPEEVTS